MKATRALAAMTLALTLTLPPSVAAAAPIAGGTRTFCYIIPFWPTCRR